jgi:hypothetical protein
MRQVSSWNLGDLGEVIGTEHLDDVKAPDAHIGELTPFIAHNVDVVRDRSRIEHLEHVERGHCTKHGRLPDILQREPHLLAIGRG